MRAAGPYFHPSWGAQGKTIYAWALQAWGAARVNL